MWTLFYINRGWYILKYTLNTCYWEGEMSRVRGQMLMGGGSTKSAKNGI